MKKSYLFEGHFNWYGQLLKPVFCYAPNQTRAFRLLTRQVAEKVGYECYPVRQYFNGEKDNFSIQKIDELKKDLKNVN